MKKKNMKVVAAILVVAMFIGVGINSIINSKAEEITETQMDDMNEEKAVKEFIKKFRKDNVSVTITTLNDLYDEFDNYDNVDENIREDILAKTSDEVIMQFLLEEQNTLYNINEEVQDIGVFSNELEENIKDNHTDFIKNVKSNYYKKGVDSYKKITVLTNKYGGETKIIVTDELDEDISRGLGKYTVFDQEEDRVFKEYGNRKFSYSHTDVCLCTVNVTFGYTLEYGRVTARYIQGEATSIIAPLEKSTVESETIKRSVADNLNEKVIGEVTFLLTGFGCFWGGTDFAHWKVEMSVEKLADSNHPTKCGMNVNQRAKYSEKIG